MVNLGESDVSLAGSVDQEAGGAVGLMDILMNTTATSEHSVTEKADARARKEMTCVKGCLVKIVLSSR